MMDGSVYQFTVTLNASRYLVAVREQEVPALLSDTNLSPAGREFNFLQNCFRRCMTAT